MKLLWILLPSTLLCVQAQNVTEIRVELGQNITMNCTANNSNTHWYMEIYHSQVRGSISRSVNNNPSDSNYFVSTDGGKYSAFGNKLMISNVSADDCRLYYCGRKNNDKVQFVDTFRLVSDPSSTKSSKVPDLMKFFSFSSFVLNILLLVTVGLLCVTRRRQTPSEPPPLYESPDPDETRQYEEIQITPYPRPTPGSECVYYKAQLPPSSRPGC